MRRIPAFFLLVIVATISIGCSKSDQGSAANTNATGTTTYSNTSAPSGGGATTTAPRQTQSSNNSTGETKIKPPTDK